MNSQAATLSEHEKNRLLFALEGFKNLPASYAILAKYGFMERTSNGFKSLDPEVIQRRIKTLLEAA